MKPIVTAAGRSAPGRQQIPADAGGKRTEQ